MISDGKEMSLHPINSNELKLSCSRTIQFFIIPFMHFLKFFFIYSSSHSCVCFPFLYFPSLCGLILPKLMAMPFFSLLREIFFFRGIRELYFSMPFSFQCQINGIEKKNAGSSSNHCSVPSPSLVFAPCLVRDSKLFEF